VGLGGGLGEDGGDAGEEEAMTKQTVVSALHAATADPRFTNVPTFARFSTLPNGATVLDVAYGPEFGVVVAGTQHTWVTWEFRRDFTTGTYCGRYFMTLREAVEDFEERRKGVGA